MDAQWKEVHLLAKKCLRPPEAGGGVGLEQIIPSSLQGECGPANTLILDSGLQNPEIRYFYCLRHEFVNSSFSIHCYVIRTASCSLSSEAYKGDFRSLDYSYLTVDFVYHET